MTINCRGKLIDLSSPKVMGILNITPDSFYDGGKFLNEDEVLAQVEKMLQEGANFIDIGGMSSRPGATIISVEKELKRIIPHITNIIRRFPEAIISVDTIHAKVAEETLQLGAHIINDVSAGRFDEAMLPTVAAYKAPFIIMHAKSAPLGKDVSPKDIILQKDDIFNKQAEPTYENVVTEVTDFFLERIEACKKAGITDTILDVGFGFGKNVEHNYTLLRNLRYFTHLNLPILTGASRKSMICKVLKVNPDKALTGTIAVNTIALMNGTNILRVHDVKEAREVVKIYQALG